MTWGLARYVVPAPLSGLLSRLRKGGGATPGPAESTAPRFTPAGAIGERRERLCRLYQQSRSHLVAGELRAVTTEILRRGS